MVINQENSRENSRGFPPIRGFPIYYKMRKLIYTFWTGDNEMSPLRKLALVGLIQNSHTPVVLVTPKNLHNYTDKPLHKSYQYLSDTHKADYLRTHFMHYHGGGYSDIKQATGSWLPYFDKLQASDRYICGYKEFPEFSKWTGGIIGNCAYICKPNTEFTNEWYNSMISLLDTKYDMLKKHPGLHPQQPHNPEGYPIGWEEMLGDIFHRVCQNHKAKLMDELPEVVAENYR